MFLVSDTAAASSPFVAENGEREVALDRTERSRTFLAPDGSKRVVIAAAPFQMRQAGAWRSIDPALRNQGGSYVPAAVPFGLELPGKLDNGQVELRDGDATLRLALPDAHGQQAAEAAGATITYPAALNGADVKFSATSTGIKDSVVFPAAQAVRPVSYRLSADGVTAGRSGGRVVFRDGDGRVRFSLGDSFLMDSAPRPHVSGRLSYSLVEHSDGVTLTVQPDQRFLKRRDLVGAIVLDPTVTIGDVGEECTIENAWDYNADPDASVHSQSTNCGGPLVRGYAETVINEWMDCSPRLETTTADQVFLKFDVDSLDPKSEVLSALLLTYSAANGAASDDVTYDPAPNATQPPTRCSAGSTAARTPA